MAIKLQQTQVTPARGNEYAGEAALIRATADADAQNRREIAALGLAAAGTGVAIGRSIVRRKQQRFQDTFNEGLRDLATRINADPELAERYMDTVDEQGNVIRSEEFTSEINQISENAMRQMGIFGRRASREWADRVSGEFRSQINTEGMARIREENLVAADAGATETIAERFGTVMRFAGGEMNAPEMHSRIMMASQVFDEQAEKLYEEGSFASAADAYAWSEGKKAEMFLRTGEAIAREEGVDAAHQFLESIPVRDLSVETREKVKDSLTDSMTEAAIREKEATAEARNETLTTMQVDVRQGVYGISELQNILRNPEIHPELTAQDRAYLMNLNQQRVSSLLGNGPGELDDENAFEALVSAAMAARTPEELQQVVETAETWAGENYRQHMAGEEVDGPVLLPSTLYDFTKNMENYNPLASDQTYEYAEGRFAEAFGGKNTPGFARAMEEYRAFISGSGDRYGVFQNPNGVSDQDKRRWVDNRYEVEAIDQAKTSVQNAVNRLDRYGTTSAAQDVRRADVNRLNYDEQILLDVEEGNLYGVIDPAFVRERLRPGAQPMDADGERANFVQGHPSTELPEVSEYRADANAAFVEYARGTRDMFWRETGLRPDEVSITDRGDVILTKEGLHFKRSIDPGSTQEYWAVYSENRNGDHAWMPVPGSIEELIYSAGVSVGE